MNISKKYIRAKFNSNDIQINEEALTMIENRLKLFTDAYIAMCKHKEYKRITSEKITKIFDYEDSI